MSEHDKLVRECLERTLRALPDMARVKAIWSERPRSTEHLLAIGEARDLLKALLRLRQLGFGK